MTTYTVQAGDTLSKIAKATGMSVAEIAKQNGIKDVNKIEIGQRLSLGEVAKPDSKAVGMDTFEKTLTQPSAAQTYAPLAYGAAGAALYQGGKKVLPKLKDMKETVQLRYMYGKDAANKVVETAKRNAKSVRNFVTQKAKHATKSAELHYAFGKDAVSQGVQKAKNGIKTSAADANKAVHKATKQGTKKFKKVKNATVKTFKRSNNILNGKRVQVNKTPIKLGKAGKLLGKAALPLTIATGVAETAYVYGKDGAQAAVKQGIKSTVGIAGGWAGAKVGAAIGTAICPGIGTAIGGFIGGIGGYLLGEKLCS